jgi:hypothetical protein
MRSKRIAGFRVLAVLGIALLDVRRTSFAQMPALPAGHPPIAAHGSEPRLPGPVGTPSSEEGFTWTTPAGWNPETPASSMRRAQYRIPGAGGPGECAVFYFGPGQGGDAQSNAARWAGQFQRPDGSAIGDAFKTREIKVDDISVMLVEVAGTFVGGMGGTPSGPEQPDQMLLGAIAEGPQANWFFRAIGPRATMEPQRTAFETMIRSLKREGPR